MGDTYDEVVTQLGDAAIRTRLATYFTTDKTYKFAVMHTTTGTVGCLVELRCYYVAGDWVWAQLQQGGAA